MTAEVRRGDDVSGHARRRFTGAVLPEPDGGNDRGGYRGAVNDQSKPAVTVPQGAAPTDLVIDDLVVGDGDEAAVGQRVNVHYVGIAWSDGKQFDASWDRNEPFSFRLGAGEVISGWDRGVAGMKVGGRRQLTIPPDLGYGRQGAGGVIKGGETLIFVVDLLGVS